MLVADVLIVGAGPAGVAAAVPLAAAGRDVVVVDKAVFPRDKCCGDGLTTLALRELEHLGFDPATVADWQVVGGAVLRSPSGREVVVPLPPAPARTPPSRPAVQLDAALVDVAGKAGATVLQGHGCDGSITDRRRPRRRRPRRPRAGRRPLRHRRRRHVEPDPQGARPRRARLPRRVARLPPVRQRRRRRRPPSTSTSGSTPTCCRATRGRSRSPTAGPTSASGCSATAPGGSRT